MMRNKVEARNICLACYLFESNYVLRNYCRGSCSVPAVADDSNVMIDRLDEVNARKFASDVSQPGGRTGC